MPTTVTLAVPFWLAAGVNMAVRVRPVPLIAPRLPPTITKSPVVPSQAKLVLGSSEKVKVMVVVSLKVKLDLSDVMATLGAVVSTK